MVRSGEKPGEFRTHLSKVRIAGLLRVSALPVLDDLGIPEGLP
jgi:hypothetical protein